MLIGIEAERANEKQKTGVEHYAKQLILNLSKIDKQNQYVLYLRTKPEQWLTLLPSNFKIKVMPFPLFWTQLRISWEMLMHPVDSLLIPASALPILHPKNSVVTIHDLAWKYYPQAFTRFMKIFLEWSTGFAVKNARTVIAVSGATKRDLVRFYKIDQNKIKVIYHGFELEQVDAAIGNNLQLPEKYILFLSTLQPRKNLEGLIDAFKKLKTEYPELPHKLVVAGKPGWKFESILQKIEQNKDLVIYLNQVSENDKTQVLSKADLLVQPSFYEGFGMQILEAFAVNVPVVCSNTSSLPEVAGEAAAYFDPKDVNDIKNSISSVLFDKSLADGLKEKGQHRLKDFSWEKCAEQTLAVLESRKQ